MRASVPSAAQLGPWLALLFAICSMITPSEAKRKLKEQEIIQRILNNYDWRVRPRGLNASWPGKKPYHSRCFTSPQKDCHLTTDLTDTGGPVLVTVNIYLRSISKIDDVNMEYSAQFTFREEWVDARLAYGRFEDETTEVSHRLPFFIDFSNLIFRRFVLVREIHAI